VLRGLWGKSELTDREVGKLAVAKHTNTHTLLSPCILLILPLSGQATKSSPLAPLLKTPC
ncbi:lipase, partial [Ectopseudomonas chengduensis]